MRLADARGLASVALGLGCGSEQGLVAGAEEPAPAADTACPEERVTFDPEEVSVLENALGIARGRDAVTLTLPEGQATPGGWRVRRVDVLVVLPRRGFEQGAEGQRLAVDVWAGHDLGVRPWRLAQDFDRDALEWEDVELPDATNTSERHHRAAWWTFDLEAVVPAGSFPDARHAVGVRWSDADGQPPLGYSNYVFPCADNWTDWGGADDWEPNDGGAACSWPMLRVFAEGDWGEGDCG